MIGFNEVIKVSTWIYLVVIYKEKLLSLVIADDFKFIHEERRSARINISLDYCWEKYKRTISKKEIILMFA